MEDDTGIIADDDGLADDTGSTEPSVVYDLEFSDDANLIEIVPSTPGWQASAAGTVYTTHINASVAQDLGGHVVLDADSVAGQSIYTGGGDDQIYILGGSVTLDAGSGDDMVFLGATDDVAHGSLSGGDGTDTLRLNVNAQIDLAAGVVSSNGSIWAVDSFEKVELTTFGGSSSAFGDENANTISVSPVLDDGQTGVTIDGRGGDDIITGSAGADQLFGGSGNDVIDGRGATDYIYGGEGNDRIIGSGDGDIIDGGTGSDVVAYDGMARSYTVSADSNGAHVNADEITQVETIQFRDATLTFDPESNAAFVMRLYEGVLGRAPDAWGLDGWMDAMADGVSRGQLAQGFLDSTEFVSGSGTLSDTDFVELLYNRVLGRQSDADGKAYWVGEIQQGMTRAEALMGFSESLEHRAQTADVLAEGLWTTDNNFQLVEALYHAFAGREPDHDGLIYWVGQLETGESINDVAEGFASSAEFATRTAGLSNADIVEYMYNEALGRPSDPDGKQNWTHALDDGLSKGDMILGFATSAELMISLTPHLFSGVDFIA